MIFNRLKNAWSKANASYWFFPGVFSISAVALALVTIWLDRQGYADFLNDVAWIQPARPTGANNMLTVISGSMIGVASTVFSITIAAVAYASGNYGPRLLTNFMEDKGNQLSLATFIGTFVYAVTVLRVVRASDEAAVIFDAEPLPGFVPQLSLLIAYILMAVSIMVLVYFLNHVPASIRINSVLQGIGRRLLHDIRDLYEIPNRSEPELSEPAGREVTSVETGYIQHIDYQALQKLAAKENGTIALGVRTGDFVHPGVTLAYWKDLDPTDDLHDDSLRDCFITGPMRTPVQDLHFLIDELVEIGLRALSPGINDPFTAVTALHWLGASVAELGRRDLRLKDARGQDGERDRLTLPGDGFDHFVARSFGAMRGAAATSRIAALILFDTLAHSARTLDDETRRRILTLEAQRLMAQARLALDGPDLADVEARFHQTMPKLER